MQGDRLRCVRSEIWKPLLGYPLVILYKVWRLMPNSAANAYFFSPSPLRRLISSIRSGESFAMRQQCLPFA